MYMYMCRMYDCILSQYQTLCCNPIFLGSTSQVITTYRIVIVIMAVVIIVLLMIIIFMSGLNVIKCLTNKVSKETQMMYEEESITGFPQASNPSYKRGGPSIVSDPYITTKKGDVNK